MINCDLGEWESSARTRALMSQIDAANIACGGHAGNRQKMIECVELARRYQVKIGAHPGMAEAQGRGQRRPTVAEFRELIATQCQALVEIAGELHHVKLHGSLYHFVEKEVDLAQCYLEFLLEKNWPVFCLAGGAFSQRAKERGVTVHEEVFADRGYRQDGTLIPRGEAGDLVQDIEKILDQMNYWQKAKPPLTICVHSDTPEALTILERWGEKKAHAESNDSIAP